MAGLRRAREGFVCGALLCLVSLVGAGEASAGFMTFDDPFAFALAAGDTALESFESDAFGPLPRRVARFSGVTVDSSSDFRVLAAPDAASGQRATDGVRFIADLGSSMFDPTVQTTTLVFDSPVTALGLDVIDFGDLGQTSGADVVLLLVLDDLRDQRGAQFLQIDLDAVFRIAGEGDDGNVQFFGIVTDAPFQAVTLFSPIFGDAFAIDALRFRRAEVTEPSLSTLLGLGVLALRVRARRRRTA